MFLNRLREEEKPIINKCSVTILKCACLNGPQAMESDDEEEKPRLLIPITLSIDYDHLKNIATLEFHEDDAKKFILTNIELIYEFDGLVVSDGNLECVTSSRIYKFSTKLFTRHPFYDEYNCKTTVYNEDNGFTYNMEFSLCIPYFKTKTKAEFSFIGSYFPPDNIVNVFNNNFVADSKLTKAEKKTVVNDLQNRNLKDLRLLEIAVNIEDLTQQQELMKYTLLHVRISKLSRVEYVVYIPKALVPPDVEKLSLCLIPMRKFNAKNPIINKEDDCIFANIEEYTCKSGAITFEKRPYYDRVTKTKVGLINTCIEYAVRFIPNRITHRASSHAIRMISQYHLESFFKNFNMTCFLMINKALQVTGQDDLEWFNPNIADNKEQKIAIKNIVNSSAFPFPYIIFGPPGTGKTSCIVECIAQVLRYKPKSKIFVTAQSNSACDEVGERLLKYVHISKIFRYYSPSMLTNESKANTKLLPSSNLRESKTKDGFPSVEELKHFPIVISTLTSSLKLYRAGLSKHFNYIFIDECAATTEPEVLIPILGLGCTNRSVFSNIVLIGDHKQLPPVISSEFAKNLGLDVSLMERMMKLDRYKPNPEYDNRYVTQLLDNYRSHEAILHFSNKEFYESKLRAKNSSDEVMLGTKWQELPNKDFPIIFHCNKSPSKVIKNGTSSFNDGEADQVKCYVKKLLKLKIEDRKIIESDIGIVTPYLAQRDKLKKLLPQGVEIGTSEYYQGREKLIIIISTVKSQGGVGFLSDERRLNVCLTRAKALMIVVGNPDTLQKNELWKRFISYCKENGAFVAPKIVKKQKKISLKKAKNKKKLPQLLASPVVNATNDETASKDEEKAKNGEESVKNFEKKAKNGEESVKTEEDGKMDENEDECPKNNDQESDESEYEEVDSNELDKSADTDYYSILLKKMEQIKISAPADEDTSTPPAYGD